ncbi:hypothetical protein [Streptomyces coryli]|uniref:hypothetical protein n=1 Tax=Streptomyces coryli TaxID=1128680 RepID=UPI003B82FDA1
MPVKSYLAAELVPLAKEVDEDKVTPGLLGFVVFALLALAVWRLMKSMNRHMGRVDFKEQPAPGETEEPATTSEASGTNATATASASSTSAASGASAASGTGAASGTSAAAEKGRKQD